MKTINGCLTGMCGIPPIFGMYFDRLVIFVESKVQMINYAKNITISFNNKINIVACD